MGLITYLLYYAVIIPLSLLPYRVLYFLSDLLFVVIYHLAGYRKKVVMQNIARAFPSKTLEEQTRIAKEFYRHFCDIFFAENIKAFTVSEKTLLGRLTVTNLNIPVQLARKGRSMIIVCGHYGNWEYFSVLPRVPGINFPVKGIYKVQKNKVADRLLYRNRSRFGIELVPMDAVRRSFQEDQQRQNAIIFLGDQSPPNPQSGHWMTFLNQETGVLFGTEKMARMYNYAVVFASFNKTGRGRYSLDFQLVTEDPGGEPAGLITEKHTAMLEECILKNPPYWLWSHRRWKHKKTLT